jgi:phage gp46-like protein
MTDLRLNLDENGADLLLEAGDLALDHSLETPILVSLFSDARAPADELPEGITDPAGWWAEDPLHRFGSLLWTLQREKVTVQTTAKLEEAALAALAWLGDLDIAEFVEVFAEVRSGGEIVLQIEPQRGSAARYPGLWTAQAEQTSALGEIQVKILSA